MRWHRASTVDLAVTVSVCNVSPVPPITLDWVPTQIIEPR
jgi:hypothetical protein